MDKVVKRKLSVMQISLNDVLKLVTIIFSQLMVLNLNGLVYGSI